MLAQMMTENSTSTSNVECDIRCCSACKEKNVAKVEVKEKVNFAHRMPRVRKDNAPRAFGTIIDDHNMILAPLEFDSTSHHLSLLGAF
jgi:hypothetical protein